jgi:hypothetical protein
MPQPKTIGHGVAYQASTWEKGLASAIALGVIGLVAYLVIRNQPIQAELAAMVRILLSLAVAVLGATLPGFLKVDLSVKGFAIRAAGALGLFVLTYFWSPNLAPQLSSQGAPQPGQSDALPTYYFDGLVVDDATKSLLSGAEVELTIGGTTTADKTDSEGKYLFSIPKAGHQIAAVFVASAAGYRAYTKNLKSNPSGVLDSVPTVFLQTEPRPSPPSPTSPPAPVVKMTGKWTEALRYTPRPSATAARIAVQAVRSEAVAENPPIDKVN